MSKYLLVILSVVALVCAAQGTNDAFSLSAPIKADNVKTAVNNPVVTPNGSRAWTTIAAPSNTPNRLTHATVYDPVNDKIYMIGGSPDGTAGSNVTLCQQYDPAANTWTDKASMTTARGWICGSYVRGNIYIIGGYSNSSTALNVNEAYSISGNSWSTKTACPTAGLARMEAVWRDSLIYLIAGSNGSAGFTTVDIYNPFTNTWASGTAFPSAAYMGTATCIGDNIIVTNAYNGACLSTIYKGAINPANPTTITWTASTTIPSPTFNAGTGVIGNKIYWVGGFLGATTVTGSGWVYDGTSISTIDVLPTTVARCSYVVARPSAYELYVMAGDAAGDWSAPNNYYYKIAFPPPQPNDVGVDRIYAPGSSQQQGVGIAPSCRVMNFGTDGQTSFAVVCSIIPPSGSPYYQSLTITSLLPGDTYRATFPTWTPTVSGTYNVMMKTTLAGDQYTGNDRMTRVCNAGNWILQEGFNGATFPPTGWQANILSGTYNWQQMASGTYPTTTPYEGAAMASYQSFSASSGYSARLISPPIPLGINITPCTLKFFMVHDPGYSTSPDQVEVEKSTDGTNFTSVATFQRYAATQAWTEHDVYLGSLSGTIYFAFKATSGYGNNMYIDFATLVGAGTPPGQKDVGVDAIIAPTTIHTANTAMIPIAKIKNYGAASQSGFAVVCSILGTGSAVRYTNTQTAGTVAAGDTARINFTSWTPTIPENVTVIMRTNLANDTNPANDRKTQTTLISNFLALESFEGTTFPPTGWTATIGSGTYNWERATSGTYPTCTPYDGTAMATYQAFSASAGGWARLMSPAIAVGTANPCTLKFFMYTDPGYPGDLGPDSVKVEYSTNGTTFTQVAAFRRYEATAEWVERNVYLGTFTGTLYFSLVGWSDYGDNIYIDYVRLQGRTGIEEGSNNQTPIVTYLNAARPNPVTNGLAHISFSIAEPTKASLKIYDASGRLIRTLMNNKLNVGNYNLSWNGTDDHNNNVAEGIYFYTLTTDNNNYTKKLVFTR